jgi:hypothetical protein
MSWSQLYARINGLYGSEWWRLAYAGNPRWRYEREGEGNPTLPIEQQACDASWEWYQSTLEPVLSETP